MKKVLRLFVSLTVIMLSMFNPVFANQPSDSDILQLLEKSGTAGTVRGLSAQMNSMGPQMLGMVDSQKNQQVVMNALITSLNPDNMLNVMSKHLKANISADEMSELLTWIESDASQTIIREETRSQAPNFQQQVMKYMSGLQFNPPSEQKTQAIMNYVKSTKVVELSTTMVEGMVGNIFGAIKASDPNNKELANMLDSQFGQILVMMKPQIEQQVIMASYYIYQNIDSEALNQYASYFQKPLGTKYVTLMFQAFGEAMNDWSEQTNSKIVKSDK